MLKNTPDDVSLILDAFETQEQHSVGLDEQSQAEHVDKQGVFPYQNVRKSPGLKVKCAQISRCEAIILCDFVFGEIIRKRRRVVGLVRGALNMGISVDWSSGEAKTERQGVKFL